MSRPQGSKNKGQKLATPDTVLFSTEERVNFLADLIVARIAEDEAEGFPLLNALKKETNDVPTQLTTQ
ncbi:MAG TPA: hypothetical protein VKQ34_05170 [Candidatus Saccharimonadales bacterium]|nr:hypothetical protein [Candidatus Saccharimonadales bacterium]